MRTLIITVMAAGFTCGACNRPGPAAVGSTDARENAATAATGPIGTSGTVETGTGDPIAPRQPVEPTTAARTASHDVTIPAGTKLAVVLDTSVGSDTSRAEQPVQGHLARPLTIGGTAVLPQGSRVSGVVTNATESGRVKGLAHITLRFDTLVPQTGERYTIRTAAVGRTAQATKKKDALEIAGPAAGGALIGALAGGKKGALIGTAAGGGAGTAVVLSTRGKEVHLPKGSALTIRLLEPVTIRVKG